MKAVTMEYPEIYLAIDNCFASKRWTEPVEWMNVIKDLGLFYVEASADCECDPLYLGSDYMNDWCEKVKTASVATGVKVANLYSGHGTYSTLGLAHTDGRVRKRFLDLWLKPMIDAAASLDAGLGFFCHAFPQSVLEDPAKYEAAKSDLISSLAELSSYASDKGCTAVGVEQMYSPHQIPWTVFGARELMETIYSVSHDPFYITIDTGHQSGQRNFLPTDNNKGLPGYMYSSENDSDTYFWLSQLGCYSPIIHLQQTDGRRSSHLSFTPENNKNGIIEPLKVLSAIKRAYDENAGDGMPPVCGRIYLTLELFTPTGAVPAEYLAQIKESVNYWRTVIPEDGMNLDKLL